VRRHLAPAGGEEIEPPADEPGRKAPQRDLADEGAIAPVALPAAAGDRHRDDHRDHVRDPIDMEEEQAEVEAVRGRGAALPSTGPPGVGYVRDDNDPAEVALCLSDYG
jgi:hypothetical protein